jgi:thiol-disulfide isomerase/thioredoxin
MRAILVLILLLLFAGCSKPQQEPANEPAAAEQAGPAKGLDRSHKGKPAPNIEFKDPDGGEISLADFKGTPVLMNLWATWCAPCVKELPTLDRLARSFRKDGTLGVIAVSQDMGPHASVEAFLDTKGIEDLGAYQDSKMGLSGALGAQVLPTSILFDAEGREVWRYVGDLDWTSPEAVKLLSEAGVAVPGR